MVVRTRVQGLAVLPNVNFFELLPDLMIRSLRSSVTTDPIISFLKVGNPSAPGHFTSIFDSVTPWVAWYLCWPFSLPVHFIGANRWRLRLVFRWEF